VERRTALKIVALGALVPKSNALGAGAHLMEAGTAWAPKDYRLQFFTAAENELLDQLTELVIPADSHSPGARAAQVSLFADLMVATSDEGIQKQWRKGLRLMQEEAADSSLAAALAKAAEHEDHPQTELERFFAALKEMTVNGYYTSAIGIHQDLQYQGNTYLQSFPGCTLPGAGKRN
jgi:Gluconate 2-dehydrogenase subunit 3